MRFLTLLAFFLLTACGADTPAEPAGPATSGPTEQTSQPAPGVTPRPAVDKKGDITASPFTTFPNLIDGCDCTLRLDPQPGGEYDIFFVFNWQEGPGVIGLNGEQVTVSRSTRDIPESKLRDAYLHENDRYSVYTTLGNEGAAGDEGSQYSGTIRVTDKVSGAAMLVQVSGTCSC